MSLPPDEVPAWGTPDDDPGDPRPGGPRPDDTRPDAGVPHYGTPDPTTHHGTPDNGTPDLGTPVYATPDYATPGYATPDYGTPDYGTPEARKPDLHSVDTIVVLERRGRRSSGDYDLTTVDGVQLGSLVKETSTAGLTSGPRMSTTYRMLNPLGFLIATLEGPGWQGPARFVLTDVRAALVGSIEEDLRSRLPTVLLISADGVPLRLRLGRDYDDGRWRLTDSGNGEREFCRVSLEYGGARRRAGLRRFSVELSPALTGAHRLLMIMATVFLDRGAGPALFRPR